VLVPALPVAVLWQRLRGHWIERIVLVVLLVVLWVQSEKIMEYGLQWLETTRLPRPGRLWVATPLETLTALSIPCYALTGLFALSIRRATATNRDAPKSKDSQPKSTAR
jgi:hypothetical protein